MTAPRRALALASTTLAAALVLSACGTGQGGTAGGDGDDAGGDGLQVLASFYPLQYVAERVGGERVDVSNLTPPAAEPHDLELSPAQVRTLGEADLVVYLSGFQAAVDEAVVARAPEHVVDAADGARLEEHPGAGQDDDAAHDEEAHEEDDHDDHDHAHDEDAHPDDEHVDESGHDESGHDGHDHGPLDPHFWLDPTRLAGVVEQVAAELSAIDPDGADTYAANAAALTEDLTALDTEYADTLATCTDRVLVTSHEAFGYLAERYDLDQVGIAGVDAETEPSPARLRDVGDVVRTHGVTTIYVETLLNPKIVETLAADLGVRTAVLDPLEGLTDSSTDYLGVMRTNLDALRDGLGCA